MNALGDLLILGASLFLAASFWRARMHMGRATHGTRLIATGLFILAASAACDAAELIAFVNGNWTEQVSYLGYAISSGFLIAGFNTWLPHLKRLGQEVAGRARSEAEHDAALQRSRRFNAGLEALGRDHFAHSWDRYTLRAELAERLSTLLGCQRVSIWRLVDGQSALECATLFDESHGEQSAGARIERTQNPVYFDAIVSGQAVVVDDAVRDPVTAAFVPGYLEPLGIGAMLDAPILTGKGVRGVVCCEHVGGMRTWCPEEVALVSAAAQYIAVAYLGDNAEALTQELTEALLAAEAASAAKTAFLANMSHEIRTPLNGVLGMAQALSEDALTPAQADKVETIRSSSELLLGVLNDVLDMSKIEAGAMDIRTEEISPEALLRETVALYRPAADQKGLTLGCAFKALPDTLLADPIRVRQVVGNLVANAVKFTDIGAVTVSASAEPTPEGAWCLKVGVRDTGCGIEPQSQERLFRRFSQADGAASRRQGGTGLGLAIARELVRKMGGDITLESVPGEGSYFEARFILTDARSIEPQDLDGLEILSGTRVLLVDDNEINRMVARCFLEPNGVEVVEAASGAAALELFSQQRFDLVLLDAHMPEMDGFEVHNRLRALPEGRDTPVMALTADALPQDRERFAAAGMDAHVAKPVDKIVLLETCAALIKKPRESRSDNKTGRRSA